MSNRQERIGYSMANGNWFVELIINHQLGDIAHHKEIFDTPPHTKKVFANMKRVGTGFSREVALLFDNMLVQAPEEVGILQADAQSIPITTEPSTSEPQKKHKPKRKHTQESEVPPTESLVEQNLPSPLNDPLPSERIEKLEGMVERLEEENRVIKELKSVHSTDDADEPVMEKEKSPKQGRKKEDIDVDVEINLEKAQAEAYNLDLDHLKKVLSMMDVNKEERFDVEEVLEVVKAVKLMTEVVTTAGATKLDEEVARQLEAELKANINWNVVIKQVKRNERLNDVVMKYQTLKRKPLTQAQARRNMIVYLKNMVGFKMEYFKGMTYDEVRPLFEKHYNFNQTFLDEVNEGVKVLETEVRQEKDVKVESSKREGESLKQEITKKQKMEEETEELKKHLQIIIDDDDDVYTDATPLALNSYS
nr:hypothetical protein [Tanacetum cinerariifolium]